MQPQWSTLDQSGPGNCLIIKTNTELQRVFSCSHLAADLNFSKYWGRRLSCPGRSIRVQVLPWTQGVRIKYKPCSSWKNENSNNLSFNLPCHFWLCMGHCCLWWRSVSAWTFLTAAAKNMKKHTIWVMHLSNVSQASCNRHHGAGNHILHPLTRLKRRVFPESHSPTSSTALLTVLLVRKYFRKTEERKREGWLFVYRQRLKNISCLFKDWFTVCQVCLKSTLK